MYPVKRVHIYATLAIALVLHLTILKRIAVFGAGPDLMLCCVVFFGLFFGPGAGLESGLAAGFLKDVFALDIFWMNTFILAIVGIAQAFINVKVFKESKAMQAAAVFFSAIFAMWLHYELNAAFLKDLSFSRQEYFLASILPASLYTGLVSIPLFSRLIDIFQLKEKMAELL